MALKNMIKLKDKVTFGRAGETKRKGTVVKLNPKTAHVKCSNGDVMSVSYGLIQKPSSKKRKVTIHTPCGPKRLTVGKNRYPPKPKRNHHDPERNPANFTAKGERAYQHIKKGYGKDPRAKEIAARTVYTMAKTTPGLVKAKRKNPTKKRKAPTRKLTPGMQEFKILMHGTPIKYLEETKKMLKRRKAPRLAIKIKIIDAEIRRQERL